MGKLTEDNLVAKAAASMNDNDIVSAIFGSLHCHGECSRKSSKQNEDMVCSAVAAEALKRWRRNVDQVIFQMIWTFVMLAFICWRLRAVVTEATIYLIAIVGITFWLGIHHQCLKELNIEDERSD